MDENQYTYTEIADQQDSFNTKNQLLSAHHEVVLHPPTFFFFFFNKERKTVTRKTANLASENSEWQNGTNRRNKIINSNVQVQYAVIYIYIFF